MSKKASSQKNEAKPQTAQVDAIRRLLLDEEFETAWTRLRVLRKQFPNFKPLLALAFEAADGAGLEREALMCAYDWVQVSPNSVDALQALANSALEASYSSLAHDAITQLEALEGREVGVPASEKTIFGEMSFAEMVLNDRVSIFLNAKRFRAIVECLQGASFPALINNLGLAHFALGEVQLSAKIFSVGWQSNLSNLFAAEKQLRSQLWCHGFAAIEPMLPAIVETTALRLEDALAKLSSLVLLRGWEQANDYYLASIEAAFWQEEVDLELREMFNYLAARIALRLGDVAEAERRLEFVLHAHINYPPLRDLAQQLSSSREDILSGLLVPSFVVGEFLDWFPSNWAEEVFEIRRIVDQLTGDQLEARTEKIFSGCDAHHEYLAMAIEFGGQRVTLLCLEVLKYRADRDDAAALGTLISLFDHPFRDEQDRIDLLDWLEDFRFVSTDADALQEQGGHISDARPPKLEWTREATADTPYPEEGQVLYEEMLSLLRAMKLEPALAVAQTIYGRYPNIAMSAGNLALAKENLGHPSEEVETLFQHALSINKDYKFARAGLARIFAQRGEPDEAEAMLAPVLVAGKFHASEWRTVLLAQLEIAKARSDFPTVLRVIEALNAMAAKTG